MRVFDEIQVEELQEGIKVPDQTQMEELYKGMRVPDQVEMEELAHWTEEKNQREKRRQYMNYLGYSNILRMLYPKACMPACFRFRKFLPAHRLCLQSRTGRLFTKNN